MAIEITKKERDDLSVSVIERESLYTVLALKVRIQKHYTQLPCKEAQ